MTTATETFAKLACQKSFESLPSEVVKQTKSLILDSLGLAMGASVLEAGRILIDYVRELGGTPESTVIGGGFRTSCVNAAFVNSHLANTLDYDETFMNIAHPGAPVIHSSLAVGERIGISGKKLLTATVVGFEVSSRIAEACMPSQKKMQKLWSISSFNALGAAAAVSSILELDLQETKHALGIAGAAAPLPSALKSHETPSPLSKNCNAWATHAGVSGALLAERGFTGPKDILDGPHGFMIMMGCDKCNYSSLLNGLGSTYNILKTSHKPYSSCRWTHSSVEGALSIIHDNRIRLENIKRIIVKVAPKIASHPFNNQAPRDMPEAIWSIPWAISVALLGHRPGPEWYATRRFSDPELRDLMGRIRIRADPEAGRAFPKKILAKIAVETDLGNFKTRVDRAKGDIENPIPPNELLDKYKYLASFVLRRKEAENLADAVERLEGLSDIREMTKIYHVQTITQVI